MLLQLAYRNIFRHRGRFLLGTFVIAVASLMLVFATGQIGGVKQALVRGMTDSLTGHILIKAKDAPRDFFDAASGRRMHLIDAAALRRVLLAVRGVDAVAAATPRLRFSALIGNGEKSTPALIMAIDPATEGLVTPDLAPILGKLASNPQAALVSPYLSRKAELGIGKEILVLTETPSEVFNGRPYDIVGHAESPVLIDEYMNPVFLINIERARKMIYVDDVATEIAVRLKPGREQDLAAVAAQLRAVLSPQDAAYLGVYGFDEVAPSVSNVGNIATGMAAIQIGAVMFVMLIIVLIITKMGLHERRAEIGTLMSLGMTRARLVGLFMSEVMIKVLIGYGLGFALAILMLISIRSSGGLRAETLVEQYMNGGKLMVPVIDGANVLIGFCVVIGAALLTTLISCWRAGAEDAVSLLSGTQ